MNIIAVDDERDALMSTIPEAVISLFESAQNALEYAHSNRVDIAFLDIEIPEMNGLVLARHLKDIYHGTNIIFVTGDSRYAGNAFDLHASGYVLKPIEPECVKLELANLRNPIKQKNQGLRVKCFGNFEVLMDGQPVTLSSFRK